MTPEFDRRSALVLDSPYWKEKYDDPAPYKEYFARKKEFTDLLNAIQGAHTYDDLSTPMKTLFDTAEKIYFEALALAEEDQKRFSADEILSPSQTAKIRSQAAQKSP